MFDWFSGIEIGTDSAQQRSRLLLERRLSRVEAKLDLIMTHLGVQANDCYKLVLEPEGGRTAELIRIIQDLTGCTSEEAKQVATGDPATVAESFSQRELELIQRELESTGAVARIERRHP